MQCQAVGRYAVGLLLCLCLLHEKGAAQAPPDCAIAASQDYRVALRSYQDDLLDPAIAGFHAYLQKCPETETARQAHYYLGEIWYRQQQFAEALHHTTRILADPPPTALYAHAALLAAQAARQLGQLDQADAYFHRVLAVDTPADVRPAALYWLGELAEQRQDGAAARGYYRRVLEQPRPGPYAAYAQYALGWLYRQRGENPQALEAFSAFLTLEPEHAFASQARFARAALLRDMGKLQKAAKAFQQLARVAPATMQDEALFWWAETAYQLGHYAEASAAYQRLYTDHSQSPRAHAGLYGRGWAEVQQGHCATAVHPWEALLQQAPQFPRALEVHYQLGVCYISLAQRATARRHLQQVVETEQSTAQYQDALHRLATLALQEEAYPEAIRYYTLALASAGPEERLRLHYLLGESYAAFAKPNQALTHWQQVLSGPPTLPLRAQALFRMGSVYMAQQVWEQAIAVLRQLWDDFPEFSERIVVATHLVRAYRKIHQCTKALPFYDAIIAAAATSARRQVGLSEKARCLSEVERYADVAQLLAPFGTSEPDQEVIPQVLYLLGHAYMQLQRYQEVCAPFTLLSQRFPDHALTVRAEPLLAQALERDGQLGQALSVWQGYLRRQTIPHEEDRPRLHIQAGRLALTAGKLNAALDFFAPVRPGVSPSLAAEVLFLTGEVYLEQEQWDLALQVYQELLDLYGTEWRWSSLARLRVGMIYEHQREWERALRTYQALLVPTTDEPILANARRRIAAIEAGRVPKSQPPSLAPSEG
ncbi:Cell division coordinator CpoB [Candidatus Entotheonellaceae bacterium PAL068K]